MYKWGLLMKVKELINKLLEFPQDMPAATFYDINPEDIDDPNWIKVKICTWEHQNYPYNKSSFDYVNLE